MDSERFEKNKLLLCNHFRNGTCMYTDDRCMFSHDEATGVPIPLDVCLFNLKKACNKSTACQYTHKEVDDIVDEYNAINTGLAGHEPKDFASSSVIWNRSFADAACHNLDLEVPDERSKVDLCTYWTEQGYCPFYSTCPNVHGDLCELCGRFAMHPFNQQKRDQHTRHCSEQIEKDMEETFAYERSKDLACGICLDVVLEKESRTESRFGLLTDCDHVFCLGCIREWRSTNADLRHGCPQCRKKSYFVIPSEYFYDTANNKTKVIDEYKTALSAKPCKYFKTNSKCPFGNRCFYAHRDAQGNHVELPEVKRTITNGEVTLRQDEDDMVSIFVDDESLSSTDTLEQMLIEHYLVFRQHS